MLARIYSCAVIGLEGVIIECEVDTNQGLPSITIVGLPDAAVQESRERVQAAIKNAGLFFPRKRVTVNLAPASIRKEGPSYDLPIALGVLAMSEQIPPESLEGTLVVGELSLDGTVRHVRGVLPMAAVAWQQGFKRLIVPEVDAAEAALIPDLEVIPVGTLADLYAHLAHRRPIPPHPPIEVEDLPVYVQTDFREIKGQEHVKRALEVAAAGGHNVLMIGPPGAGKTLLARAVPGILPRMTIEEALDVTRIYSVADQLPPEVPLVRIRPFRAPHHTISHAGLVGGGNWPHPGEISLAHRGVLFLDELPEFGPRVLEVMRQPMEDKIVTISRAQGSLTFPANFQLIAAMNPCPCGYYGDPVKACTCSPGHRHQVPETHLRPAARPHRHPHRSAAGRVRQAERPAPGRAVGRRAVPGGSRPPAPARALRQRSSRSGPDDGTASTRASWPATPTCARPRCASSAPWTRPAGP